MRREKKKIPLWSCFQSTKAPHNILKEQECTESLKKAIAPTTYTSLLNCFKLAKPFIKNVVQSSRNKDLRPGVHKKPFRSDKAVPLLSSDLISCSFAPYQHHTFPPGGLCFPPLCLPILSFLKTTY